MKTRIILIALVLLPAFVSSSSSDAGVPSEAEAIRYRGIERLLAKFEAEEEKR